MRHKNWLRSLGPLFLLACLPVFAQPAPSSIELTPIVTAGLTGPVGVTNAGDGSNRLFVIQQGGALRVVRDNLLLPTNYLTLTNAGTQCAETAGGPLFNTGFVVGSEQGLLGLAFHPQFGSNGRLFLSYSGANGDTVIARVTASNPAADVLPAGDAASCVVILRVDQDFSNHNGGNIVFGPDGFLYFGLGDGGSGNDPCNRGQTLNPANLVNTGTGCASDDSFTIPPGGQPPRSAITRALLGKMVRLDVDGTTAAGANGLCGARLDGAANYAIPADNPFAGADSQGGCDEIWSYGWRNPWRWSFDRLTRDLIVGDVGQGHWEEIDLFPASLGGGRGANADWNVCEGRHIRNSCSTLCANQDTSEVILAYPNGQNNCPSNTTVNGIAVTGGYRYRGSDPDLQGVYFFGDAGRSNIYYTVQNGGAWTAPDANSTIVGGAGGVVVAFGEDEDSNLYVMGIASGNVGRLTRIGSAGRAEAIFANGFE